MRTNAFHARTLPRCCQRLCLQGAEMDDVEASAQWPGEIREFVQTLARAKSCTDWRRVESREVVTAIDERLQAGRTTIFDARPALHSRSSGSALCYVVYVCTWVVHVFCFAPVTPYLPIRKGQSGGMTQESPQYLEVVPRRCSVRARV